MIDFCVSRRKLNLTEVNYIEALRHTYLHNDALAIVVVCIEINMIL